MDIGNLRERIALALINERFDALENKARPADWNWAGYSIGHELYLKKADEIITPTPTPTEVARKLYSEARVWTPSVKGAILDGLHDKTSAMTAIKAALLLPQMTEEAAGFASLKE